MTSATHNLRADLDEIRARSDRFQAEAIEKQRTRSASAAEWASWIWKWAWRGIVLVTMIRAWWPR